MMIPSVLRLLESVPKATKLYTMVQRASQGDREALEYLKKEGIYDGLDIWQPGMGEVGRRVTEHIQNAATAIQSTVNGNVIEGDYRVIDAPPWESFVKRLLRQPNSGHVLLGPMGSGKTSMAIKLAHRLHVHRGYKVEAVNLYESDVPPFAVTIGIETIVDRMHQLSKYLKTLAVEDDDEDADAKAHTIKMPPMHRVIIIDEASLTMSSNPNDPARKACLQALAQSRHLGWHVIWIGQWAGQIPLPILGQCVLWIKKPSGREATTDRNHPIVRDLWQRAADGFGGLRGSQWYREPWLDERSWAFCDCQSINGERGYAGMVPFSPYDPVEDSVPITQEFPEAS